MIHWVSQEKVTMNRLIVEILILFYLLFYELNLHFFFIFISL